MGKYLEDRGIDMTNGHTAAHGSDNSHHDMIFTKELATIVAQEINNPVGFVNSNLGRLDEYIKDIFTLIALYQDFLNCLKDDEDEKGQVVNHLKRIRRLESEIELDFIFRDTPSLIKESREGVEKITKIVQDLKEFAHP
jgi:hypothetical protein